MERFVIIVNGWKPSTIITKRSMLDVAAVLDPPLITLILKPSHFFVHENYKLANPYLRNFLILLATLAAYCAVTFCLIIHM